MSEPERLNVTLNEHGKLTPSAPDRRRTRVRTAVNANRVRQARAMRDRQQQRPMSILRAIASKPDGMSLSDIFDAPAWAPWHGSTRTYCARVLKNHHDAGRLEILGMTAPAWQRTRSRIWGITETGRAWLADFDSAAEAITTEVADRAALAAAAAARLEEARKTFGPQTPRDVRKQVAHELVDIGCTLKVIGSVFGVSREMIRQDLKWDGVPRRGTGKPRISLRQRIRSEVAEEIATAIERSACSPGEQCRDRFCADCIRYEQATADAELARRLAADPGANHVLAVETANGEPR